MLRRFPCLNSLPLQALKAQGDVRRTIHAGVAKACRVLTSFCPYLTSSKELVRRNQNLIALSEGNDLLSRLREYSISKSNLILTETGL